MQWAMVQAKKKTAPKKKSAPKKSAKKASTAAQRQLARLVAGVSKVKDAAAFCDELFVALAERISELDAADEVVLYYLGTQLLEHEVSKGGFAQAFINLGVDSQFIEWARDGYKALAKPKAAAILKEALALAKKDASKLREVAKIAKGAKTARAVDAYIAYRQLGTFSALEDRAEADMFFSNKARLALVKKYQAHFAAL